MVILTIVDHVPKTAVAVEGADGSKMVADDIGDEIKVLSSKNLLGIALIVLIFVVFFFFHFQEVPESVTWPQFVCVNVYKSS